MAKVEILREQLTPEQAGLLRPYHIGLDADGKPVSKFKYLNGAPRQYRFDAKEGKFKMNLGGEVMADKGRTITFQPIAWRIFYDPNLFNRGPKTWAELFFVNEKDAISAVMFHGYSVDNLKSLIEPLFYDDLTLADVTLTITAEKKTREDNGSYYIAVFSFEMAKEMPADLAAFLADSKIYRNDTLTDLAEISSSHGMAYLHRPHAEHAALSAPVAALPESAE